MDRFQIIAALAQAEADEIRPVRRSSTDYAFEGLSCWAPFGQLWLGEAPTIVLLDDGPCVDFDVLLDTNPHGSRPSRH